MSDLTETDQTKAELRAAALARRDALPAAERQSAAEAIAARAFPVPISPGTIVSGFMPMKTEINPLPLMRKLADCRRAARAAGDRRARQAADHARLDISAMPLKPGQWGIREPMPEAPEVAPDILIVPLACFDRHGHRIGYGAGYYDMTINALRAKKTVIAVGIAFAAQEIPKVPATERDARLDLVLTEREVIDFRGI